MRIKFYLRVYTNIFQKSNPGRRISLDVARSPVLGGSAPLARPPHGPITSEMLLKPIQDVPLLVGIGR